MSEYNYVIIGGGSAGCVLANRLSANKNCKVLLLEAGGEDNHYLIHMPVGFAKMTTGPYTWGYVSEPQKHAADREIVLPQGRVIGGGGSINALVFTRGVPQDYDNWEKKYGCEGWGFEKIKKYFIRSEGNDRLSEPWHGTEGPLGASDIISPHPLTKAFVQACQEFGLPYNGDFNGATQEGAGIYQTTTRNGKRCSAAVGYLKPVRDRSNLTVITGNEVSKLIIENGVAKGVEHVSNGTVQKTFATEEVLLAAGAIGSPKLLMLSGIGPSEHLKEHGIECIVEHEAIGTNLHDHCDIDIVYELREAFSLDKYNKKHWAIWAGIQYYLFNSGPVTSNVVEGGAFSFRRDEQPGETPDFQFHFLPAAGAEAGVPPVPSGNGCTLNTYQVRPQSRGTVKLRSNKYQDKPLIDPNYLADPIDLKASVEALKQAREIMKQPSLAKHIKKEHYPGVEPKNDKDCEDYVRNHGRTSYHHCGTVQMGGEDTPLDPQLRVRGIEKLRVIDSSVMPHIVSSNTNAPTMMIAEKGADMILGKD